MRRLLCFVVVCMQQKQVFSKRGPFCSSASAIIGPPAPAFSCFLRNARAIMRGSRNLRRGGGGGGVQVSLTKKSSDKVFFLVLSLFYRRQMVNFKEIFHFSRFQRGSNIFQGGGGVQLFPGGSNSLFPIETHITCDFPGGGGPDRLSPPLDPHLAIEC